MFDFLLWWILITDLLQFLDSMLNSYVSSILNKEYIFKEVIIIFGCCNAFENYI